MSQLKGTSPRKERPSGRLKRLLAQPVEELPISELRLRLRELLGPLQDEWAEKDTQDGLYEQVREQEPAWDGQLKRLRDEQGEIARAMRELILLCERRMTSRESFELRRERLSRKLRTHEGRENQLLLETYFRDVGGE